LNKRRCDRHEATDAATRPPKKRDKSGNFPNGPLGWLLWVIQLIASGALPVIGGELGKVIWSVIALGALPWLLGLLHLLID